MKALVLNSGSSSLKFKLFELPAEQVLAGGIVERIGEVHHLARVACTAADGKAIQRSAACPDHATALAQVFDCLAECCGGEPRIDLVGHRLVHGSDQFNGPVLVDDAVMARLRTIQDLAPLHMPPALAVLQACRERLPRLPHVASFDTTFYRSMPAKAYRYAVPRAWFTEHGVRRFGFHGISHEYIAHQTSEALDIPLTGLKLISAHLGNGASVTAFDCGRVLDTSMGFTPLEGLIMGTRAGYLDPAVLPYMQRRLGLELAQLVDILNTRSGLKAISGRGRDMRTIMAARQSGDPDAGLAIEMYVHTLRKYIGAYHFALSGARALVFTGGIGENGADLRALVLAGLEPVGVALDDAANRQIVGGRCGRISAPASRVQVWVIPTDEERMIARQAHALVAGAPAGN